MKTISELKSKWWYRMFQVTNFILFIILFYICINQFTGQEFEDAIYISYEQCDTSFRKLPNRGEIYSSINPLTEQQCIDDLNSDRYVTIALPILSAFIIAYLISILTRLIFFYITLGSIRPPKN